MVCYAQHYTQFAWPQAVWHAVQLSELMTEVKAEVETKGVASVESSLTAFRNKLAEVRTGGCL
jgi:hypothetical protein